jgi:hypothetical protein
MAERVNTILLVPNLIRLLRYLGKTEWPMTVYNEHGIKKFNRSKCVITWSITSPNEFSLVEVEEWTNERVEKKLELNGQMLSRLTDELNRCALSKAKEDYINQAAKQYLNDQLMSLDP